MAKTLTQIGIETGNIVEAYHISQSIDAFTGTVGYDIYLSGSFNMTGSINGEYGIINPLTSSYAITASHVITASYSDTAFSSLNTPFAVITASNIGNDDTIEFLKGGGGTFQVTVNNVQDAVSSSYAITASHVPNTFVQNGNSFGTTARLGTNDSQPIVFETNNLQRMNVSSTGTIGMGSGGQGTLFHLLDSTIATIGNVSASLITLPTSPGIAYTVQAYVVGWGGGNGTIGGEVIGVFSNIGGTLSSAGTPITSSIENFTGSPTFTLTGSGTDIVLQVSGSTATTINWSGHMKYLQYDSNI
jgi:hypothetical protein